ncbi:UPF0061-domain-containing protein [Meira miltonrushii]|uniref:Selenoprotein O n=1 Tax=Meira miltonrushii TaxID=1280837 RepID=A0A316V9N7_9BASI|nr:UPF0061-domain-containing protein [Meira miltonrushii]PWN32205.1 UPF0061-domain-containing protein [Meira miltonrushii]
MTSRTTNGEGSLSKRSILNLPLAPKGTRFTERLLPDPLTPTPSALVAVEESAPSLLRRSRQVGEGAHFSYTTPLALEFPYSLEGNGEEVKNEDAEEDPEQETKRVEAMSPEERETFAMERAKKQMEKVERLMRPYEVTPEMVADSASEKDLDRLQGYLPKGRKSQSYPSARILGYSKECLQDCVPDLDVGDLDVWLKEHAKKDGPDVYTSGPMAKTPAKDDKAALARYELSDFLSGRLLGLQLPDVKDADIEQGAERGVAEAQHKRVVRNREGASESSEERWKRASDTLAKRQKGEPKEYSGYAPWSNAYSGHQFGQWAGQLGDGRAITLMETYNSKTNQRYEIQLKGAGRTPYSRFADGLAVLFSSVREFLASEAMHGLGIPTSRALCLTSLRDISVRREQRNPAAIVARIAPIWVRVGSFEHHATRGEWESVRLLGEFTCEVGYGWKDVTGTAAKPWAERLIKECVIRNAKTIALWQVYGFMHGVMNTDNISVLGLTIDYGPYGFMDIFDRHTICNKSDSEGRYAYHMQPTAAMFVMEQLTSSLAAIVGFERKHGRPPRAGELVALSSSEINELGKETNEQIWTEMKSLFMDTVIEHWQDGWRKRLALQEKRDDDRYTLIEPLTDVMDGYLDMTHTMRKLSRLPDFVQTLDENDSEGIDKFVESLANWENDLPSYVRDDRKKAAVKWVKTYVQRLREERVSEKNTVEQAAQQIKKDLQAANPSFILRNWVADEVIERLQNGDDTEFLEKVLGMCLHPFQPWGEEKAEGQAEDERLCSLGTLLTTNMPSCSS